MIGERDVGNGEVICINSDPRSRFRSFWCRLGLRGGYLVISFEISQRNCLWLFGFRLRFCDRLRFRWRGCDLGRWFGLRLYDWFRFRLLDSWLWFRFNYGWFRCRFCNGNGFWSNLWKSCGRGRGGNQLKNMPYLGFLGAVRQQSDYSKAEQTHYVEGC